MSALGITTMMMVKAAVCLGVFVFLSFYLRWKKGMAGCNFNRRTNLSRSMRILERLALGHHQEMILVETATEQITMLVCSNGGTVIGRTSRIAPLRSPANLDQAERQPLKKTVSAKLGRVESWG